MGNKILLAYWNGKITGIEQIMVSPLDRSFLFGDAIYEMILVVGGKLWLGPLHWARMQRCLDSIQVNFNVDALRVDLEKMLQQSKMEFGLAYCQVSRGTALRQHAFPADATPNRFMYIQSLPATWLSQEQERGVSAITHPDIRWQRRDLKTTNLLGNCLANQKAKEQKTFEAIFVDKNELTEATHSNVFFVLDGKVWTAPADQRILNGVTRLHILSLLPQLNIEVVEKALPIEKLGKIDEAFLTNTTGGVLPICRINDQDLGGGKPGKITQSIAIKYFASMADLARNPS